MLRNPCILGDPQQRGTKSVVATSTLPSRGPKRGRNCYATPAFSGIPNKGEENQRWLPHPCLPGGPKEGGIATQPLVPEQGFKKGPHRAIGKKSLTGVRDSSGHIAYMHAFSVKLVIFFFAVTPCNFFSGKHVYKKIVKSCNFFCGTTCNGYTNYNIHRMYRHARTHTGIPPQQMARGSVQGWWVESNEGSRRGGVVEKIPGISVQLFV